MKYALINGKKSEAFKGAIGICPSCSSQLIAKCGEERINHWAHKGNKNCDHWWEKETEWHRTWKDEYPIDWQEVVQYDKKGERHIADVKTNSGLVLEFQHSYIKPEERRLRIEFYTEMVWVVDGLRRINDKPRFIEVIKESTVINLKRLNIFCVNFPEESRILKEWLDCSVPVLFDFHDPESLWFLIPNSSNEMAFLIHIGRNYFIENSKNNSFENVANKLIDIVRIYQDLIKKKKQREENRRINLAFNNLTRKRYRRRL